MTLMLASEVLLTPVQLIVLVLAGYAMHVCIEQRKEDSRLFDE